MSSELRRLDRALRALPWLAAVAFAVALGMYAEPPPLPEGTPAGLGRPIPRLPPPPTDLPALLFQLGVGSTIWYAAAVAVPLMLLGARQLDVERLGRVRTAAIAALAVAVLIVTTAAADFVLIFDSAPARPALSSYWTIALRQHVLPWVALAGIIGAVEARRRARVSIVERERLRAQVAEQRLIALTGQLHPHFLFNTLQGISTLIHRDPDAADAMLARLADLLRDLLRHRDRVLVSLEDEVAYARTYLEISQLRFGERLTFAIDVPLELKVLSVPLFILQPLLENALAHGVGSRLRGGHVILRAERRAGRLRVVVTDDGPGPRVAAPDGVGLSNTRDRLRAAFGSDYTFSLEAAAGGGTAAIIDVPERVHAGLVSQ